MPIFSEATFRFETGKRGVRQRLLQFLIPWLDNMELVDPNVPPLNPLAYFQGVSGGGGKNHRKEGWGSAEATEMVLNNLFYITVKFGDEYPVEMEGVWAALCSCWSNNLRVILRYLLIVVGMAPDPLLPFAKRVVGYMAKAKADQLVDELIGELGTAESLHFLVERTQTPPFFRLTAVRKGSTADVLDPPQSSSSSSPPPPPPPAPAPSRPPFLDLHSSCEPSESRDYHFHTKKHSGDDHRIDLKGDEGGSVGGGSLRSASSLSSGAGSVVLVKDRALKATAGTITTATLVPTASEDRTGPSEENNFAILRRQQQQQHQQQPHQGEAESSRNSLLQMPRPLPMPEYGGFFAPMSEFLPESSQPITAFHRCNLAVLFLTDLVSSGSEGGAGGVNVDWTIHLPLMLHMLVLGLDHTRALVAGHCVSLLAQLLIVLGPHGDHLSVAGSALKAISSCSFSGECGGDSSHSAPPTPTPPAFQWDFTKSTENLERFLEDPHGAQKEQRQQKQEQSSKFDPHVPEGEEKEGSDSAVPVIVTTEEGRASEGRSGSNEEPPEVPSVEDVTKALIHYLFARKDGALWAYEDITARTWDIKSAGQLSCLVRCVLRVFRASLPHARLEERWAQISLHVALSCSSRHYAGRSLQVFRALGVPVTSRVLTDILSRLVETVAEQGEDMQGYVAEIMLTLETAVDSLDCDFHAIDATKDLFKSTPNLNDQEPGRRTVGPAIGQSFLVSTPSIPSHARSTSYSTSHGTRKPVLGSPTVERRGEMRNRSGTEGEKRDKTAGYVTNLSRSRSAQSLKVVADSASRDDKMSVLAQLFWIATFVLESDYEYEFLLALRLLNKVLSHFPLDRPDCREKLERIQMRMKWTAFPGLHSLVLKGLTNKDTYEPALALISKFTTLMDLTVVDPSGTVGFPINVMALLPYMIHHYEDANDLCICSAENIAQVSLEKSSKLENLATVMTLYSHRNFSKESFQWTKCVVKYLHDAYSHLSLVVITFLVEVLEKGPTLVQAPILNILHCILHYIDIHSQQPPVINGDLLRAVARFVEGPLWKEALKILKLVVTRSSVLAVPPSHLHSRSWDHTTTGLVIKSGLYVETPLAIKKELPGRTMDFSFDVSQTPIIGRRFKAKESGKKKGEEGTVTPKRSPSQTAADNVVPVPGWKRPWLSQSRTRECLVNLLNSCGQRVGLPKSPSVIFSQTSELLEHQSSMASSMEEMSNMEASGNESHVEDTTGTDGQFTVFKDFDFLDNEESEDGSDDNFNWGVKRSIPDLALIGRETEKVNMGEGNVISKESHHTIETSSDDDETGGSDDHIRKPPDSLSLQPTRARRPSEDSDSSYVQSSSEGDMGDLTPCNASPCLPGLMSRGIDVASLTSPRDAAPSATLSPQNSEETSAQEHWQSGITTLMAAPSSASVAQAATAFPPLYKDLSNSLRELVEDSIQPLSQIESVGLMIAHLGTLRDSLSSQELPFLWIGPGVVECELQKMKFILLEIHEHFETFIDKKEHAIECLEALRCALKLQSLGEMIEVRNLVEKGLDLCRAIYKLSFQLSLAWDAGSKMVSALSSIICTHSECLNVWADVTEVHNEIQPLLEEIKDVSSSSTDDEDHHGSIVELLQGKHWASAIREFRAQRGMDSSSCLMASEATLTDDLQTILTSYMEYLSSNSKGVVCLPSVEQFQNDQMLMEGNIQLLSMLRSLEQGSVMECTSSPKKTFPVLV